MLGGKVKYFESSGWNLSAVTSSDSGVEDVFLPPYDVIHVGAAAREIPQVLIDALKVMKLLVLSTNVNSSFSSSGWRENDYSSWTRWRQSGTCTGV
jgi:hypothetical protein